MGWMIQQWKAINNFRDSIREEGWDDLHHVISMEIAKGAGERRGGYKGVVNIAGYIVIERNRAIV